MATGRKLSPPLLAAVIPYEGELRRLGQHLVLAARQEPQQAGHVAPRNIMTVSRHPKVGISASACRLWQSVRWQSWWVAELVGGSWWVCARQCHVTHKVGVDIGTKADDHD